MSFRSVRQAVLKKVWKCTREYLLQLKDTLPNMKFTRKISRYYHPSHYIDTHVDFNFTTAYQSRTMGVGRGYPVSQWRPINPHHPYFPSTSTHILTFTLIFRPGTGWWRGDEWRGDGDSQIHKIRLTQPGEGGRGPWVHQVRSMVALKHYQLREGW